MAIIATGQRDDALDIVQDAMIKLVQKYATRDAEEWGPLFHRILQTTIRDWYRRSRVRNGLRHLFFSTETGTDEPDPINSLPDSQQVTAERELHGQRRVEAVDRALRQLPLRQQQVFLLRAWEGLDVKQTAEAMGCSPGSVKTHYSRAVQALRRLLEGQEDE